MYEPSEAAYALKSYIWKLLQVNFGWDQSDYGIIPIIPAQQQPEIMQTGKPFLVYGSAIQPPTHLYQLQGESISYIVYATSATETNKIASLLADTFVRQDEAAADVNEWLDIEQAGWLNQSPQPNRRFISFGTIRATLVQKANPTDEEGGFYSALVMLDTKYVNNSLPPQTNGFTYP